MSHPGLVWNRSSYIRSGWGRECEIGLRGGAGVNAFKKHSDSLVKIKDGVIFHLACINQMHILTVPNI